MRRKIIYLISAGAALYLGLTVIDMNRLALNLNLPYRFLGESLRSLSLTSPMLNVISIILFVLVGIIPLIVLALMKLRRKILLIDFCFMILITAMNFVMLYFHVNPGLIVERINPLLLENLGISDRYLVEDILLNGLTYMLIYLIMVYAVVSFFIKRQVKSLLLFRTMIDILAISLLFMAFTSEVIGLRTSLNQAGITGYDIALFIIEFVINIVIYSLSIYLLLELRVFIQGLMSNGSSEQGIRSLKTLYKFSVVLMLLILTSQFILNGYQLVFLGKIKDVSLHLDIPIISVLIAVVTYVVSEYFVKMKAVEEDNALII